MTYADKAKLDGIQTGAQVNVQADWDETNASSDAFILNKPNVMLEGSMYINIVDYGADTTNSAAVNTTAIQNAIDAATSLGATIYIPDGTFEVNNLSVSSGVLHIIGNGISSILKKMTSTGNLFDIQYSSTAYHISMSNFTILSGTTQTAGAMIYCENVGQSKFIDLFIDSGYYNIQFKNVSQSFLNRVSVQHAKKTGIYFEDCLDLYIDDSRSDVNTEQGIHFNTVSGVYLASVTTGANGLSGIYIEDGVSSPATADTNGFYFFTNVISDSNGSHNWHIKNMNRSNIVNCWASTGTSTGQYYGMLFDTCEDINISNSSFVNNQGEGVYIYPTCKRLNFSGNNFNGNGVSTYGGYGIKVRTGAENINITSNTFIGNITGNINDDGTNTIIYLNNPDDTSIVGTATNYAIKYPDGSLDCVITGQDLDYLTANDYSYVWNLPVEAKDTDYVVCITSEDSIPIPNGNDFAHAGDVVFRYMNKSTTSVELNAWTNGYWTNGVNEIVKVGAILKGKWR